MANTYVGVQKINHC